MHSQNFLLVKRNSHPEEGDPRGPTSESEERCHFTPAVPSQFCERFPPYSCSFTSFTLFPCEPSRSCGLYSTPGIWNPRDKLQNSPVLQGIEILWSPQICFSYSCLWFQFVFHHISMSNRVSYMRCIWCKIVNPFSWQGEGRDFTEVCNLLEMCIRKWKPDLTLTKLFKLMSLEKCSTKLTPSASYSAYTHIWSTQTIIPLDVLGFPLRQGKYSNRNIRVVELSYKPC